MSELDLRAIRSAIEPGPCVCHGEDRCATHRELEQELVPALVEAIECGGIQAARRAHTEHVMRLHDAAQKRAEDAEAKVARLCEHLQSMRDKASDLMSLDPRENGISAGEAFEAGADYALATRLLGLLDEEQGAER
jgi:hypothetical protein